jgi:hypothetical protein
MLDTFSPLGVSRAARDIADGSYVKSWLRDAR